MPIDSLIETVGLNTIAAVVALALAVAGVLIGRRRRGDTVETIPIEALPWNDVLELIDAIRQDHFQVEGPPPERDALVEIDQSVDTVERTIARRGYIPDWPLSYHYRGEHANLVRYYYDPDRDLPHRQVHVRLYGLDARRCHAYVHEEPTPIHHPQAHLSDDHVTDVTEWFVEHYRAGRSLDPPLNEIRDALGLEDSIE